MPDPSVSQSQTIHRQGVWSQLTASPHRVFFAVGTLGSLIAVAWWVHYQWCLYTGQALSVTAMPAGLHFASVTFGVFTPFILGFLITVFPKWLGFDAFEKSFYRIVFLLFGGGLLMALLGMYLSGRLLLVGGILVWTTMLVTLIVLVWKFITRPHPAKGQPGLVLLGYAGGVVAGLAYLLYLAVPDGFMFYTVAYGLGIYFYLPLVILGVAFRMIPFFSHCVLPNYTMNRWPLALGLWLLFSTAKTAVFILGMPSLYLITDLGLLVTTLIQMARWNFFVADKPFLLSMLYYAMAWFPLGCLLYLWVGLQALTTGMVHPWLEEGALHALTIGCYGSIMLAFATRVTLGHSGRPLQTSRFDKVVYALFQLGAISRVGMGIAVIWWPLVVTWTWVSGLFWLVSFGLWAYRYLPIYFSPRVDGQPG